MAIKIKAADHATLTALYDAAPPRETPGVTVGQRKAMARKGIRSTDRRGKKTGARRRQYNTNVTDEIWELVDELLDEFDLTKAEFTERAIRRYAAALKAGDV
jgi:hypothetical protein